MLDAQCSMTVSEQTEAALLRASRIFHSSLPGEGGNWRLEFEVSLMLGVWSLKFQLICVAGPGTSVTLNERGCDEALLPTVGGGVAAGSCGRGTSCDGRPDSH